MVTGGPAGVAEALGWSPSKISRYELARSLPCSVSKTLARA